MTRPVVPTPPCTISGAASGIKAPRIAALDANAEVTAPDGAQQQRDHQRRPQTSDAAADRFNRAVALKRAHVGHDAADEQHDAPGDLPLGAEHRPRKRELQHGADGQRGEADAEAEPQRRDGDADQGQERARLLEARMRSWIRVGAGIVIGAVASERRDHIALAAAVRPKIATMIRPRTML